MKAVLEKLKSTREVANAEVFGDHRTAAGRDMVRRQAQAELPIILKEALDEFKKVGFPVLLNGEGAASFMKFADELHDTIKVDFKSATQNIRNAVSQSVSGRNKEFSPSSFSNMLREIRQAGADLGLTSIPDMSYDGPEQVETAEQIDSVVDKYLLKYVGADFIAAILEKEALSAVITSNVEGAVVPVLITGLDPSMHASVGNNLFGGKYVVAETNKKTNQEDVVAVFNQIKAKKNKKNNSNDNSANR